MKRGGDISALTSISSEDQRPLGGGRCLTRTSGDKMRLAECYEYRGVLHQQLSRFDLVRGRSHESVALLDPPGQKIRRAEKSCRLRAEQRETSLLGHTRGPLQHAGSGVEIALDEVAVPEADEGGGEMVRAPDLLGEANCATTRVVTFIEVPDLGETACEPPERDRLERPP